MTAAVVPGEAPDDDSGRDRERLLAALAAGGIGAHEVDLRSGALWWSPQTFALFGLHGDQPPPDAEAAASHVDADDRDAYRRARAEAIASGRPYAQDFRVRLADGTRVWRTERGAVVCDTAGVPVRVVGVVLDTEASQRQTGAPHGAEREKDLFVAGLVHELRGPLAPIRNALTLLQRRLADDAQARWCHEVLDRQVDKMTRLLDDLLDASRLARGQLRLQRATTTLSAVLLPVVESLRPAAESGGRRLVVELPAEELPLHGDPSRLAQVFTQVLAHAVGDAPRAGTVRLSAAVAAGDLRLRVRSAGPEATGAPPTSAASTVPGGKTAGDRPAVEPAAALALARGLVELHGGELTTSGDERDGTQVLEIRLPLPAPDASGRGAAATAP